VTTNTKAGFDNIMLEPNVELDMVPNHEPRPDGTYAEDSESEEESFMQLAD